MKKGNYIREEFRRLFGRRSVLISVIVLLLVPLVYAMIMLSPKWGPQDNIDNLPVAVVNNDQGADSDGEIISIGNELVGSLEENRTLGWDFVSSEAADKGMDDMKYYMTIEVPEDFSERALTVLDDNPERPELKFTQNEGLHYMASQVTNTAKNTIQGQLSDQITETYVQTVVDKLGGVSEGFEEAADGAGQINDGSGQLKDGSEEMLSSLTEKYPDIIRLAEGAEELNAGTNTLKSSLVSKQGDISKLANGSIELNEGTNTLKSSLVNKQGDISKLAEGSKELNAGTGELLGNLNNKSSDISKLADGAKQVNDGTGLLLSTLNEKSSDISRLNDGANQLADGANQVSNGANDLSEGATKLEKGSNKLVEGAQTAKVGSTALKAGLDAQLAPGSQELAAGVLTAQEGVNETIASMGQLQGGLQALSNMDKNDPAFDITLQALLGGLNESLKEAPQKQERFKELVAGANRLRDGLAPGSEFNQGLTNLDAGLGEISAGTQAVNAGAGELADGGKRLAAGAGELFSGATQVADGTKTVRGGWTDLQENVAVLHDGTTQVAEGNQTVKSGWSDLQDGATRLHDGSTQIKDGNQTVESGWRDLTKGATDLHDGSTQIRDGNQTVESGWRDLTKGATDLHDGSTQISDGNQTVRGGWVDLTDGVTQIDGGILQLLDGSGELHEGLLGGAEEAGALDPGEENVAMFANPVMAEAEVVNSFPFYRDANAPYVITLALFVGVLAMSFIVSYTRPAVLPPSAISWFMGKVGILATLAVAQALIISLYSLIVLRLEVQSSLQFILFSIFVSLTFLMIVLFLVALAGNIGRFLALVFAVLQLSTTGSDLPIHMLPEGLRNLSVFLPFTYSIDGFKNIITLGSTSSVLANTGVLFIYFALFGILAAVVFFVRFRKLDVEIETEDDDVVTE